MVVNNAHVLIKDFLSDLTNSDNKRHMENITAEAKRAITEYDEQIYKNSSDDTIQFFTVSSTNVGPRD